MYQTPGVYEDVPDSPYDSIPEDIRGSAVASWLEEVGIPQRLEALISKPNDHVTWTKAKGILVKLLRQLWDSGKLYGNSPSEAFYCKANLGETMTEEDVLNGDLIVEIGVAVTRPKEFTVIEYKQNLSG